MDDQIHAHQDLQTLKTCREEIRSRLDRLAFCVNHQKSMLGESQKRVRYLGMLIDTDKGVFVVPEDKRTCLLEGARAALNSRQMSALWPRLKGRSCRCLARLVRPPAFTPERLDTSSSPDAPGTPTWL